MDLSDMAGDLIGAGTAIYQGNKNRSATKWANRENIKYQKEFAKNALQWKVADAKKAGVHPLFGLGATTGSFTPTVQPAVNTGYAEAGSHLGNAIKNFSAEKKDPYVEQMKALDLYDRLLDIEHKANRNVSDQVLTSASTRAGQRSTSSKDKGSIKEYDTGLGKIQLGNNPGLEALVPEFGEEAAEALGIGRLIKEFLRTGKKNWIRGFKKIMGLDTFKWPEVDRKKLAPRMRR